MSGDHIHHVPIVIAHYDFRKPPVADAEKMAI